jgi:hypothetical protein
VRSHRERERERERERAIAKGFVFAKHQSSSSVQQLPYARPNSLLDHKSSSSSSSTTTWRRRGVSSKRRSLLLHVCVHPQLDFTHQQLVHYSTALLLPRAQHRVETQQHSEITAIVSFLVFFSLSLSVYYCLLLMVFVAEKC